MNKIISFCLFGDNPKYTMGAIKNCELAQQIYPDWQVRMFINLSVPPKIIDQLYHFPNVFIHPRPVNGWHMMAQRFLPASWEDIDVMISRDSDSRLSLREKSAVDEFLKSDKLIHNIADHPYHFHPLMGLMGGLCGFKKGAVPQMKELIEKFIGKYENAWQCDQNFLRDYIQPIIGNRIMAHSDLHQYCNKFPFPRQGLEFCGEIIDENERPNMEHREVLRKHLYGSN